MSHSFSPKLAAARLSDKARAPSMLTRGLVLAVILAIVVNAPALFATALGERVLLAVSVGGLLFLLLVKSPRDGLLLILVYLAFLGGLRRWLIPAFGWAPQDPLVLVQATVIGCYVSFILVSRRLDWDTRLAKCLGCLLCVMVLEIANPLQSSGAVGLGGVLFMLVPLLWYYAGRRLGTPEVVLNLLRAALVISILGAMYGLYQTWFGYLPSEQMWVDIHRVSDIRPFSFFTLMPEYALFLTLGVAVLWAAVLKGNRAALLPMPLLAVAIFFLSSRGTVVSTIFVCTALWAIQGKSIRVWLPRAVLAAILACFGLIWSMHEAQKIDFGLQTQALVAHQTAGILDPAHSSAPGHATMIFNGVIEGLKAPLGHGLGSTSLAAGTFGTGSLTTESDWGDSFVALGIPGGLLYSLVIVIALLSAVRQWIRTRSFVSLTVFGILLSGLGHWMYGDFYAMTMLIWFLIGAQDRPIRALPKAAE